MSKKISKVSNNKKRERFNRGINYLNNRYPNWQSKIDIEKFDLRKNSNCILGQLYGGYIEFLLELVKETGLSKKEADEWAKLHGFYADANGFYQKLWKKYLNDFFN